MRLLTRGQAKRRFAVLAVGVAVGVAASAPAAPASVPSSAFDKLRAMNGQLKRIIDDELSGGGLIRAAREARRLEADLVNQDFASQTLFGLPFGRVFFPLERADALLLAARIHARDGDESRALGAVRKARRSRDDLAGVLATGRGVPSDASDDLGAMGRRLRRIVDQRPSGDALVREAKRAEDNEHDFVTGSGQIVFGLSFADVFFPLVRTDASLLGAQIHAANDDGAAALRAVRSARRNKGVLEDMLSGASPTPGTGTVRATFGWSFVDQTMVRGVGAFSLAGGYRRLAHAADTGDALTAIKVVIPPAGSTPRQVVNQVCPDRLPTAEVTTTVTVNDSLICAGGPLPLGESFAVTVQTSPNPSPGMGGQLLGQQDGTFRGPFAISGP